MKNGRHNVTGDFTVAESISAAAFREQFTRGAGKPRAETGVGIGEEEIKEIGPNLRERRRGEGRVQVVALACTSRETA